MQHCRGFEETVNWTFDDWKTSLQNGTNKIRFEYCIVENNQIQYMRSVSRMPADCLVKVVKRNLDDMKLRFCLKKNNRKTERFIG